MAQKKKLQVFISSTYTDLQEERQAAVQAILTAGHIPAGMELFAAGDETQMNVIKRWIDESDVYMLILGGRYGSIEPKSGKSYIHLEYEYALEKNRPLFAVVIDEGHLEERMKKDGFKVVEKDHSEKLKAFRELVCSKMVKFWKDNKDIKLSIMETMADFSGREELIGWIRDNESINTSLIADELAKLTKENSDLREKLQETKALPATYNGLTFDEYYKLMLRANFIFNPNENFSDFEKDLISAVYNIADIFQDEAAGLIHVVWLLRTFLQSEKRYSSEDKSEVTTWVKKILSLLKQLGLTEWDAGSYNLTEGGRQFIIRFNLYVIENYQNTAFDYLFRWNPKTSTYKFTTEAIK